LAIRTDTYEPRMSFRSFWRVSCGKSANRAKSPGTFGRIELGSLGQAGGCARDAVGDCDGVTAGTTLRCCGPTRRTSKSLRIPTPAPCFKSLILDSW
jgi:hypothetical protein